MNVMRESEWLPGETAYFEYHCNQSHDSEHAQWWYRTRQAVTILGRGDTEAFVWEVDAAERSEACVPRLYRVRWADGFEGEVFEDELHETEDYEWLHDPQFIAPPRECVPA